MVTYIIILSLCFNIAVSAPRITEQPNNVKVSLYKSASFECTAYGFGLINIIWKRINYTLPITAKVTIKKSLNKLSSRLEIHEIIGYYSGEYYCVAENAAGITTSHAAKLHVKQSKLDVILYICQLCM